MKDLYHLYLNASLAVASLILTACVNDNKIKVEESGQNTPHIEQFYHSFIDRNKGGLDNGVKKERMDAQFLTEITDSLTNSDWLLEDLPLELVEVKRWSDEVCIAHFCSRLPGSFNFVDEHFKNVCFDIVGKIPEDKALKLKDGEWYIVRGKLEKFLDWNTYRDFAQRSPFTDRVGIAKLDEFCEEDNYIMNIGMMFFDIASVTPYNK